jgi:RNA polymerase sigma-70 factor (ECF subfamily)
MDHCLGELEHPLQRDFTSTHWSVVLAARDDDDTGAKAALEKLCETYWYPLYAFVRRKGHSPHDAEDLTQAFFHRLIEKDCLRGVHPSKGRFRAFLLASMKNFLANEMDKAHALKRGGNCRFESLDGLTAEERYAREPGRVVARRLV